MTLNEFVRDVKDLRQMYSKGTISLSTYSAAIDVAIDEYLESCQLRK